MEDLMDVNLKDLANVKFYSNKLKIHSFATVHLYMYYQFIKNKRTYLTIPKMMSDLNLSQPTLNNIINYLSSNNFVKKQKIIGEKTYRILLLDEGRQNLTDPNNMKIAKSVLGMLDDTNR